MPAPSPERGSAPTAPRCSRLTRMVSASTTILCDLRPLMSAMKPTPQESFSCAGSKSPKPCAPIVIFALPPPRLLDPRRGVFDTSLSRAVPALPQPLAVREEVGHAPEGEPLFLKATFVPLGGRLPLSDPGCSSAALRRALALGGWPP